MFRECGHEMRHRTISRKGYATYAALMLTHELEVLENGAEGFPARELACMRDNAVQVAMRFDPWIDDVRDSIEILRTEGGSRLNDDYPGLRDQSVRQVRGYSGCQPVERRRTQREYARRTQQQRHDVVGPLPYGR